jgi:dTDP-4-dehydrorhamnose reductase
VSHVDLNDKNILLIGHQGMLGTAWQRLLNDRGLTWRGVDVGDLDITDAAAVCNGIGDEVDLIINCAAYTNVDGAEDDEATATRVNGHAVRLLAERARDINALLVHYSTDYVFDGQADSPYPVDALIDPINAYGRSKAVGEKALADSGCQFLLIRTSWLYAAWAKNFVLTIRRVSGERDQLRVVNDQRGRPTSCTHLAATTLKLIEADATGPYHVTDGGECTWFEFASSIAAASNPDCRVDPCTTAEYPTPATRPAYSVLDLAKTEAIAGPMPSWQDNLAAVLAETKD